MGLVRVEGWFGLRVESVGTQFSGSGLGFGIRGFGCRVSSLESIPRHRIKLFVGWGARDDVVDDGSRICGLGFRVQVPRFRGPPPPRFRGLSDTMHLLISLRKSTAPQNRRLNILISTSAQQVDILGGGVHSNKLTNGGVASPKQIDDLGGGYGAGGHVTTSSTM